MRKNLLRKRFIVACLFIAILSGCAPAEPEPTEYIKPTITPLPFIEGTEFPTGIFEHVGGHWIGEFREDGTAFWYSTRVGGDASTRYGVNGNLWSEMQFSYPVGRELPATYFWHFDGNLLTFQVWGVDYRAERWGYLHGGTYKYIGEAEARSIDNELNFPTGRYKNETKQWVFDFKDDGTWHFYEDNLENPVRSGKYVTNGKYYTEMTHDDPDLLKAPATYIWTLNDQKLSFELWEEEVNELRKSIYDQHTYIRIDE